MCVIKCMLELFLKRFSMLCLYVSVYVCVRLCVKNVKISFNVRSIVSRSFALRLSLVGGLDCPNLVRLLRSSGGGSVAPG